MAYSVVTTRAVDRALGRLPRDDQRRVAAAMRALADNPRLHGYGPIRSRPHVFRIRVGDRRVLYTIDDETAVVQVVEIMSRQADYRP